MKKYSMFLCLLTLITNLTFSQTKGENFKINWSEEYNWKVGSNQENDQIHMVELVPGGETIDKWTTLGTMISYKGVTSTDVNQIPQIMFNETIKTSPNAKLTVIDKDDSAKYPWILFKIESPSFTNDPLPESQLFYVIQGQTSLYSNFVAIKEKILSDAFIKKWSIIFKAGEIINN